MGKDWFDFFKIPHRHRRGHHKYEPFYDDHADYNTNAPSYYDFLARWNRYLRYITDFINRLMNRNIEVEDTNTIDFTKNGDWIDNGECEPNNYDDIIKLKADVKISSATETKTLENTPIKNFTINNGTKAKSDGIWSPNYDGMVESIDDELGNVNQKIENIEQEITDIRDDITNIENILSDHDDRITTNTNALQKIIDNLFESGAITSNNINNLNFKTGRNIATGNINLFGGTTDGDSFIRTNDGKSENDITAGF